MVLSTFGPSIPMILGTVGPSIPSASSQSRRNRALSLLQQLPSFSTTVQPDRSFKQMLPIHFFGRLLSSYGRGEGDPTNSEMPPNRRSPSPIFASSQFLAYSHRSSTRQHSRIIGTSSFVFVPGIKLIHVHLRDEPRHMVLAYPIIDTGRHQCCLHSIKNVETASHTTPLQKIAELIISEWWADTRLHSIYP